LQRLLEWDDLRFFLELTRCGTILATGEKMGVKHSTVSRRIDKLEESLGVVLFDRRRSGYTLTEAGTRLTPYAEQMESAHLGAIDECSGQLGSVSGIVRVGTPEAFGIRILAPSLHKLYSESPGLHVELMAQPQFPSLVTREVEILVTLEPPKVGRYKFARLAEVNYYLYGAPSYLASRPSITGVNDLAQHDFVDYIHDGSVSERYRFLAEVIPEPRRSFTTTSVLAQRAAAAAGMGLVILAPYVAQEGSELINVFPSESLITRTLWIATPEDLFRIKRIRRVWDFIREVAEAHPDLQVR